MPEATETVQSFVTRGKFQNSIVLWLELLKMMRRPSLCWNGGMPKINTADSSNRSFAEDGGYEKRVQPVPGDCGYHLHAHWLVLSHPASHERIRLVAPLPSSLQTQAERAQVL